MTLTSFIRFFYDRNMKQNLIALLADVFNLFEIHPAQCVDYPESEVASGESSIINVLSCLQLVQNFSLPLLIFAFRCMVQAKTL